MASFLVVAIPGMRTPGAAFMREHPHLTMDFALRPRAPGKTPEGPYEILCMARGSPPEDLDALRKLMQGNYPTFRMDHAANADGTWLASYEVPAGPVDPVFKTVSRFMDLNGLDLRWGRLERGVVYMRSLVEARDAQRLAAEMRSDLQEKGHDAKVTVEAEPEPALAIWLQVLRKAHGVARP